MHTRVDVGQDMRGALGYNPMARKTRFEIPAWHTTIGPQQ